MAASQDTKLTSYSVVDDVVVPPEYERYVIVRWGDRVFPDPADYFGYNNDYTGFVGFAAAMTTVISGLTTSTYPFRCRKWRRKRRLMWHHFQQPIAPSSV